MIQLSIREWEKVAFGTDGAPISEGQADCLAKAARNSNLSGSSGEGVLEHRRKHLRARGVVGVISAGDCQLEILPKIDASGEAEAAPETLRRRLIHMLSVARDLRIDAWSTASLGWQRDTLLEILIRIFCRKMTEAVRHGIPRRYIDHEDDLPSLRGRLNVSRQFSVLAAKPQNLACEYDELSPDIDLNRVMKAAILKLSRISTAADNLRSLRELSFVYAEITDVAPSAVRWDRITLDRTNDRWLELLSLAKLLLGNRHQTTNAGNSNGHALLFEMNVLFEEYVAKLLKRGLAGSLFSVSTQGGKKACLFEGDQGQFGTRPDILIRHQDKVVMVIDTKWKRISSRIEDAKHGINQGDVYQMMAYSQLYECDRVMLLYPYHQGLSGSLPQQTYAIGTAGASRKLLISTIDVSRRHSTVTASLSKLVMKK
ncbi:restriction endonuclease [uncultured Sulfitobacter sp.]|uniref:McrC family protein n=1 Tax=uncultured Sulfitobacter sp. TaxID=191468 RepID=UPI0032B309A7|tara:strand:- start:11132 stop:12415 length:1284 start_codon:yes stop_codon:yes gene_type:complete